MKGTEGATQSNGGGWGKAQEVRESTTESRRHQTRAFLWWRAEVLRAGRMPESLNEHVKAVRDVASQNQGLEL